MNKETLKIYNERLSTNNTSLNEILEVVSVLPTMKEPNLQEKEVTPTKETQTINYDEDYDGLESVTVNAIPDEYIIPNGTLEITENGIKDVTTYENVNVNLEIKADPVLQDKEVTITENTTTTIQADGGFDGLNKVSVVTDISTGGVAIEKGVIVNACNSDGYVSDISIVGISSIPVSAIGTAYAGKDYRGLLNKYIEKITISDATSIGNYAFAYLTNLVTVKLPDTLTNLGTYTFQNCTNLTSINIPSSLTSIKNYCFTSCSNLALTKLPDSITTLYNNCFAYCTNLALTELPSSLINLYSQAFTGCSKLAIKQIPDGVISIGNASFSNCTNLTQISMNNVTTLSGTGTNNGSFANCTGLKAVWIGSAITSDGFARYVFYGCSNLTKMFIDLPRATVEAFTNYSYAFSNSTLTTDVIICNDDEGFMTQEEFDTIDWSTYTE